MELIREKPRGAFLFAVANRMGIDLLVITAFSGFTI